MAYGSIDPVPYLVFIWLTKDGVNLTLFVRSLSEIVGIVIICKDLTFRNDRRKHIVVV